MGKRVLIHELFRRRVELFSEARLHRAEKRIKKEVPLEVLKVIFGENADYLLPMIVIVKPDAPTVMRLIGYTAFGREPYFFYQGDEEESGFYKSESPAEKGVYVVKPMVELSDDLMGGLLGLLEERIFKGNVFPEAEVFVPDGFYLFRFTAQWTLGGHEDSCEKVQIISADSFEAAARVLRAFLLGLRENCFSRIRVRMGNSPKEVVSPEMVNGSLFRKNIGGATFALVD